MDFDKRSQIRRMLSFLDYKKDEQLFMPDVVLSDKSFPSCSSNGVFYSNFFLSRRPLLVPSDDVVNHAHSRLSSECNKKIALIRKQSNMPWISQLLKKYYYLEFLKP